MTSAPCRSRSWCQSSSASPKRRHASRASTSSQLPGKRRTPNFTSRRREQLDLVVLDERIGEQLVAHPLELRGILDVELDDPADVNVARAAEAERRQRALDRLAL